MTDPTRTGHSPRSSRWDVEALKAGGSVSLVFAVPLSVAAQWLVARADDQGTSSGLAPWLALAALAAFVVGGGVAAWHQQKGTPLSHAIVAAGGAFLAAQAVLLVVRLVRGEDVRWLAIIFNFTLTLVAGVIGGFLGSMMQRRGVLPTGRRPPASPDTGAEAP